MAPDLIRVRGLNRGTGGGIGAAHRIDLAVVRSDDLAPAVPWREFRWNGGQRHYSGLYWSATTGGHVAYESRLELSRLILADFDPGTVRIVAQPFLLEQDGARHVRGWHCDVWSGTDLVAMANGRLPAAGAPGRDARQARRRCRPGWQFHRRHRN